MGIFSNSTPFEAIALILRIGSIGVAVSSLELLLHGEDLGDQGLLDGEVQSTRSIWLVRSRLAGGIAVLSRSTAATVLLALRLVAACTLIAGAGDFEVARFAALVVAVTTLLLRVRSTMGIHASGAMVMLVYTACTLGLAVGTGRSMRSALVFIAAQACLAYFVAGSGKLGEATWRNGTAIPLLVSTLMWGRRSEALLLRAHPSYGRLLCWFTMAGECSVALSIFVPLPIGLGILALAALCHVVVAVAMRLPSFVWAFVSTYPAIIFCSNWFHHGLAG